MLWHHDPAQPILIIGDGVVAQQMLYRLQAENTLSQLVSVTDAHNISLGSQCLLGFMNHAYRISMLDRLKHLDLRWPTYIHPTAVIETTSIGQGVVILDQCHVGWGAKVGDWCYLDTRVSVCHGSSLGQHCVLTVGTLIAGSTQIGNNVVTGLNSLVRNKISICDGVTLAMNSVVSRSIDEPGCYYGTRRISKVDI